MTDRDRAESGDSPVEKGQQSLLLGFLTLFFLGLVSFPIFTSECRPEPFTFFNAASSLGKFP